MPTTPGYLRLPGLPQCTACTVTGSHVIRVNQGYGVYPNKIMIIAQAPGKDENFDGRPLVGRSGQLLASVVKSCGLDLDLLYRTNVNKCWPKADRKPTLTEQKSCRKWLDAELEQVDPDIILALGDVAFKALVPDESSPITQIEGSVFEREIGGRTRYIIPTLHPAFVIRNPIAYEPALRNAILKAKALSEGQPLDRGIPFRKHAATWEEVLEIAASHTPFGFDLETDRLKQDAGIIGVGICNTIGDGRYYPFADLDEAWEKMRDLRPALESSTQWKIVSNAKFERHVLHGYDIEMRTYHDTLIEAWLLGDQPLSLKDGVHHAYGIEMIRIDKFAKLGYKSKDWRGVAQLDMAWAQAEIPDQIIEYSAQDPDASLRLHTALYPMLQERGLLNLYEHLELPFSEIIFEMEDAGMLFDKSALEEPGRIIQHAIFESQSHAAELCGDPGYLPTSVPQTIKQLYLGSHPYTIPKPKQKKNTPEYPTDKISLGGHIENPLVREILTYKGLVKMRGYIKGLPTWVYPKDGRVHAEIKQTGTSTGRVSSANPNMQNIPARKREDVSIDIEGAALRKAFIAAPGNYIYAPDLSQIEMRIAAHVFNDVEMIRLITDGLDIHDNSARGIYGHSESDVPAAQWKNERYLAKTIGFGVLYGLAAQGLIARTPTLKLSVADATRFIDGFYATYPGLRSGQEGVRQFTRAHGYAETLLGRRRYLPDITANDFGKRGEAERAAVNVPIQGSAADLFKLCILAVADRLREVGAKTRFVQQVHDEIVLEGPQEELELLGREVVPVMTTVYDLKVPIKVDFEYGTNWGDLKKWKAA